MALYQISISLCRASTGSALKTIKLYHSTGKTEPPSTVPWWACSSSMNGIKSKGQAVFPETTSPAIHNIVQKERKLKLFYDWFCPTLISSRDSTHNLTADVKLLPANPYPFLIHMDVLSWRNLSVLLTAGTGNLSSAYALLSFTSPKCMFVNCVIKGRGRRLCSPWLTAPGQCNAKAAVVVVVVVVVGSGKRHAWDDGGGEKGQMAS